MIVCSNRGCGVKFTDNDPQACRFHPGQPLFHEGLKSWTCCNKKVTDFDEFLKIPGCTVGPHNDKPQETPKKQESKQTVNATHVDANGVETYGSTKATFNTSTSRTSSAAAGSTSGKNQNESIKTKKETPKIAEQDLLDAPEARINVGAKCLRPSCKAAYQNESSRQETCVFHAGQPIFHEGSKGWSCCSRKVLEFDEFLKIKGCKTGKHRFTNPTNSNSDNNNNNHNKNYHRDVVECRRDWYQTPTHVIISVFAKKADTENTKVTFSETGLNVHVQFQDGKEHQWTPALNQPIEPQESSFIVLGTKVEITLKKANGISWPDLEPTDQITSWTTFGTTGFVGTVGAKEAVVSSDAPILFFKK